MRSPRPDKYMMHHESHADDTPTIGMTMTPYSMYKRPVKCSRRRKAPSVASSSILDTSIHSISGSGFRLKRAFFVGRRSPYTPVPSWKVHGEASTAITMEPQEHAPHHVFPGHAVSARKLAASVWELQELPLSRDGAKGGQNSNNAVSVSDHSRQNRLSPEFSHATKFKRNRIKKANIIERQRVQPSTTMAEVPDANTEVVSTMNLMLGIKAIAASVSSGQQMTTSELLKVLNHVWNLEEQHASSTTLVGALQAELTQARSQIQGLLMKEKLHFKEVENLSRKIGEERVLWQQEKEESIRLAVQFIRQELENERKSKQKLEMLHKRVARDLQDASKRLSKVLEDLERERRARELMEDVCDELAREIGEDKACVEELKRESVKVREEVEEERKMLQVAEVWREERVQMKLMEAKLELEEKNMAVHKLRQELESFLKSKRESDLREDAKSASPDVGKNAHRHSMDVDSLDVEKQTDLLSSGHSTDSIDNNLPGQSASRADSMDSGSDDAADDDDLHFIELNNDSFRSLGSNEGGTLFGQSEYSYNGRRSTGKRSTGRERLQRQLSKRSQGENEVGSRGHFVSGKDERSDFLQDSHWVECSFESGEVRDWTRDQREAQRAGREETNRSWKIDNGNTPRTLYTVKGKRYDTSKGKIRSS